MVLDQLGHTFLLTAFVNIFGFALLIWAAQISAYFKSAPWLVKNNKSTPGATGAGVNQQPQQRNDEAAPSELAQPSP
jgi:hypothetical protein